MKAQKLAITLLVICICMISFDLLAQCPMCRMSAESNLQNGGSAGKGLNQGILYMLALPYLFVTTMGILWWRNHNADKEDEMATLN